MIFCSNFRLGGSWFPDRILGGGVGFCPRAVIFCTSLKFAGRSGTILVGSGVSVTVGAAVNASETVEVDVRDIDNGAVAAVGDAASAGDGSDSVDCRDSGANDAVGDEPGRGH